MSLFRISYSLDTYAGKLTLPFGNRKPPECEKIIFIPKIKKFKVNFTRENSSFNSSCASYDKITMEFDYLYAVNVFDYEALSDPDIKKEFDEFIKECRKAQIEKSRTFFNQDF